MQSTHPTFVLSWDILCLLIIVDEFDDLCIEYVHYAETSYDIEDMYVTTCSIFGLYIYDLRQYYQKRKCFWYYWIIFCDKKEFLSSLDILDTMKNLYKQDREYIVKSMKFFIMKNGKKNLVYFKKDSYY